LAILRSGKVGGRGRKERRGAEGLCRVHTLQTELLEKGKTLLLFPPDGKVRRK
jgi:hypothetical protein